MESSISILKKEKEKGVHQNPSSAKISKLKIEILSFKLLQLTNQFKTCLQETTGRIKKIEERKSKFTNTEMRKKNKKNLKIKAYRRKDKKDKIWCKKRP